MNNKTSSIDIEHLNIARGEHVLCEGICLSLQAGDILHVQGSNGVGKTSLLMTLAGLLDADAQTIRWGGVGVKHWDVLYLGCSTGLNVHLTPRENLAFFAAMNEVSGDIDTALQQVDLLAYADVRVGTLSAGQKRRVALARLWLEDNANKLWLLDEPYTALDTAMALRLDNRLEAYCARGGRVVLTSHQPLGIQARTLDLTQFLPVWDQG